MTTAATRAQLADVDLPDFGIPSGEPLLEAAIYVDRLERLRTAMDAHGYDRIVVWADREHSANLAFLNSFAPSIGPEVGGQMGPGQRRWARGRDSRCYAASARARVVSCSARSRSRS